ncbi:unnamed protein product [Sympodiomycopsis kandeliae]
MEQKESSSNKRSSVEHQAPAGSAATSSTPAANNESPPSYAQTTGGSSNGSVGVAGGDNRPLPPGWVKQWDGNHRHNYYVDTKANPPRSIWTHPMDDADFLKANPQYRNGEEKQAYAPPPTAPPQTHSNDPDGPINQTNFNLSQKDRIRLAGDRAAEKARSKPDVHGLKKVSRSMKDKTSGMDHIQRARNKAEREEATKIANEERAAIARAFLLAAQFGQPQFFGRDDRAGVDYYAEPPAPGFPIGLLSSFPPPYGFESRRDGPRVYIRPAGPTYSYRGGYGAYGGGMGMPLMGGLAGGMLLGSVLF